MVKKLREVPKDPSHPTLNRIGFMNDLHKTCAKNSSKLHHFGMFAFRFFSKSNAYALHFAAVSSYCSRPGQWIKPGQVSPLLQSFLLPWFNENRAGLTS